MSIASTPALSPAAWSIAHPATLNVSGSVAFAAGASTHICGRLTAVEGAGAGAGAGDVAEALPAAFSSTRKTSWRKDELDSPAGSVPSVFSQFEVNSTQRPSADTF